MKLAIVIPAKGNPEVTITCFTSFLMHHKDVNVEWTIFHADTGSNENDLNRIKQFCSTAFNPSQFKLIEYDWYNFAKINNDVVFNHIDDSYTHILFCNNDIQFIGDLLTRSFEIFEKNSGKIGTIGYRLLYPNGTIQHDGQFIRPAKQDNRYYLNISHINLRQLNNIHCQYGTIRRVIGNTFACVMTEMSLFKEIGGLSSNYLECFEDVQYNLECIDHGRQNICLESIYSAFHHESLTRDANPDKAKNEGIDYRRLVNFYFRDRV